MFPVNKLIRNRSFAPCNDAFYLSSIYVTQRSFRVIGIREKSYAVYILIHSCAGSDCSIRLIAVTASIKGIILYTLI